MSISSEHLEELTKACDDAKDIKLRTFVKHVGREATDEIARNFGYSKRGLTMAKDYHIRYYKSKMYGEKVLILVHSAIDHVFTKMGEAPNG